MSLESLMFHLATIFESLLCRTEPRGILMPRDFEKLAEEIYTMDVRPDDVWMITYPKAGSTWTQV